MVDFVPYYVVGNLCIASKSESLPLFLGLNADGDLL